MLFIMKNGEHCIWFTQGFSPAEDHNSCASVKLGIIDLCVSGTLCVEVLSECNNLSLVDDIKLLCYPGPPCIKIKCINVCVYATTLIIICRLIGIVWAAWFSMGSQWDYKSWNRLSFILKKSENTAVRFMWMNICFCT